MRAAYPIHPEVFDRLYSDWSTLVKFQRTRGVLRLMAAVIHDLWEKGDRNPLILPASLPIDEPRVQFELTRYLSDNWVPVIAKDVDGPNALPLRIDGEVSNLGKYSAFRRAARTIYLGSAPIAGVANIGIEDRRVKLGCVMPGGSPNVFGDALRYLASRATYLYQDGTRYWYSTQPTVTKLAEDRAEELKRKPDQVAAEIEDRVRGNVRKKGDFSRIHPFPRSAQEVPDDLDARLVVLGTEQTYAKGEESPAAAAAKVLLESRGPGPRLNRNTLVFLAPDRTRLQDLDEATRRFLAWNSILTEKEALDLSPFQVKQAENQRKAADETVEARIPETFLWLLVPGQATPKAPEEWQAVRLLGSDTIAVRASKRLRNDDLLIPSMAGTILKKHLTDIDVLWRGKDHVEIRQLAQDFARYLYLPRLTDPAVLVGAVRDGLCLLTWETDSFAYADSYDEEAGRYVGLRAGQQVPSASHDAPGLVVEPEAARRQLDAERKKEPPSPETGGGQGPGETKQPGTGGTTPAPEPPPPPAQPRRYHGSVNLDPQRVGRDAGQIAAEIVSHLAGLVGAKVRVTLEIEAEHPEGIPENVVHTVTENSRTLKFTTHGFETE